MEVSLRDRNSFSTAVARLVLVRHHSGGWGHAGWPSIPAPCLMCHVSPGAAGERGWLTSTGCPVHPVVQCCPSRGWALMRLDMNQTSGCYVTSTLHDFLHIFLLSWLLSLSHKRAWSFFHVLRHFFFQLPWSYHSMKKSKPNDEAMCWCSNWQSSLSLDPSSHLA